MDVNLENNVFGFLLGRVLPLVLAPPGSHPAVGRRLRGVVRPTPSRARVILSRDAELTSGVGFECDLVRDGSELAVEE